MTDSSRLGGSAAVIGGSIAGLATAKALASSFSRVTVIDRDDLPSAGGERAGVPQGRHLHVLLAAGKDALEELLPGVIDDLVGDGAVTADLGAHGRAVVNGHRFVRAPSGYDDILASRPFVEHHVRRRLLTEPNVTVMSGTEVRDLVVTRDRRRVVGIELTDRGLEGPTRTLTADLVVDCTGRRSSMPQWLERLGYAAPPVDTLRVDVRYMTRRYRVPPAALSGDEFVLVSATPGLPRGGGLARLEGGEHIVTLFGMAGERPPVDDEGFEAFAATLAAPDIAQIIRQSRAVSTPTGYRYPANLRRRYERLRSFPDGLLVTGDAVCSFNPIYGQGMSVAALEALRLRDLLRRGHLPRAREWFRSIAPLIDTPWDLAVGGDLAIDAVQGRRTPPMRIVNAYLERYYRAAEHDAVLATLFGQVSSLLVPPGRLLHPATVARVVLGGRDTASRVRRRVRSGAAAEVDAVRR